MRTHSIGTNVNDVELYISSNFLGILRYFAFLGGNSG